MLKNKTWPLFLFKRARVGATTEGRRQICRCGRPERFVLKHFPFR
ncbi:unnamed protein product [Musa acuminata subsp. malaccensis]|uniref:(wild Malaysian banana) hypothetical protein n=1 Tax=Musa acuminata subsp. malaccensis TaxID=214687 RepID=A0A8D7F6U2_MUSAM|nr:unnamed protein product [Musa acuminata subsp. malaccensis]